MIKVIVEVENKVASLSIIGEARVCDLMVAGASLMDALSYEMPMDDFTKYLDYIKEGVAYERKQMCEPDRRS